MKKIIWFNSLSLGFFLSVLILGCKKDTPKSLPILTTTDISSITNTSALSGGIISSDGNAAITERGVCWALTANPTIAESKTNDGTGSGTFTSKLLGLSSNTTYYIRAYASNGVGIGYGSVLSFKTLRDTTVTDIDGNVYNIVAIGTQLWMKENLRTTRYSNGDTIGTTWPASLDTFHAYLSTNNYQWAYEGNENNVVTYGRLYSWYAVADKRKICPIGWRVPSEYYWTILGAYLDNAGGKLKELGNLHWTIPNTGATNETGFTALPGGGRFDTGIFTSIGKKGYWWTSDTYHGSPGVAFSLDYNNSNIEKFHPSGGAGLSVRCVCDKAI